MSFIDEISGFFGEEELFCKFRATLFGNKSVYFEKVKEVIGFSKEKIQLRLKKGQIIVEGEELCIKKYCAGDVAIVGKIKSISLN